ncbi:hypothetical protein PanWU01x14_267910 [Parasponia andersonii]|uniref:Uncharacterized protein n=1 Tax=Parasponia andersonii TaxID=3476 RepID=A0A2P5B672_PARAD|nr:hypothetical protein PanWU01x14_267910 [Parasponia andersonii]
MKRTTFHPVTLISRELATVEIRLWWAWPMRVCKRGMGCCKHSVAVVSGSSETLPTRRSSGGVYGGSEE